MGTPDRSIGLPAPHEPLDSGREGPPSASEMLTVRAGGSIIQRLYVTRDCHGKGVAHDLMSDCMQEMTMHRSDVAWLGVWERNPGAIAFYMKFGFLEVGAHVFPLGSDPQRNIVMAGPVTDSPPSGRGTSCQRDQCPASAMSIVVRLA